MKSKRLKRSRTQRRLDRLFDEAELTSRQREVMQLCFTGLSDTEIREELRISLSTLRHHIDYGFGKLGCDGRRGMLRLYAEWAEIEIPKKRRVSRVSS